MFLPSLAEQNVPSVLSGTVSRDSVGGCVSVVPISLRVVRWYKAATGDGWIVTLPIPWRNIESPYPLAEHSHVIPSGFVRLWF
jgi:hypothetical protein